LMKNKKLIIIAVLFWTLAMIAILYLFYRESPNLVYKSITIEDYKAKDVCRS
jgi:signal transduction histidine kinase